MITCQCGGPTSVTDTRDTTGGIWRRRRCKVCRARFSTFEQKCEAPPPPPKVTKIVKAPKPVKPAAPVVIASTPAKPARLRLEDLKMQRELEEL